MNSHKSMINLKKDEYSGKLRYMTQKKKKTKQVVKH